MRSWAHQKVGLVLPSSKNRHSLAFADLSTGPTSLIGLLTADVVEDLTKEGYTEQAVASAVALMMGVYGMLLGFLKLGFILDFISIPTLTGFISAAAITIGLGQIANLVSCSTF